MYTIGQVAKKYSISRSTLIYYDTIGLLIPSGRSSSNYRLHSDADLQIMEKISQYRAMGLSLDLISKILHKHSNQVHSVLESRLFTINNDIRVLRDQQKVILDFLKEDKAIANTRIVTKATWVALFKASGLDESNMKKWHKEFERLSPEGHQDFLESLGINNDTIKDIRKWSREQLNEI